MSWTHPAHEAVAQLLRERTGLVFGPGRRESAELGMRRAMTAAGIRDPWRYLEQLGANAGLLDELIVELTIGETYFFREPEQFAVLRREILPEIRERRGWEHGVRAWSAGCASGEEAYSLAILFTEAGLTEGAQLLATDISRAALAKARRAEYGPWSLRGEGAGMARRYLQGRGEPYRLDEPIRRRVVFEHLNLALDVYPSFATGTWGMDVILCRNVLIYFDAATVEAVARRLFEALAPGGWLLTASSDPPLAGHAPFETVTTSAGILYRRECVVRECVARGAWRVAREDSEPVTPLPDTITPPRATRHVPPAPPPTDAAALVLHIQALANLNILQAERACAEAVAQHTLSTELHYLHAVLLLGSGRADEAIQAVRRVLYLDRSLAVAHFTLGALLAQHGDLAGARRAYRNARDLCAAQPADTIVPLSDGEHAGRLTEAAAAQLTILEAAPETTP